MTTCNLERLQMFVDHGAPTMQEAQEIMSDALLAIGLLQNQLDRAAHVAKVLGGAVASHVATIQRIANEDRTDGVSANAKEK